jgi:queuine tRNA-ribosyltransferase
MLKFTADLIPKDKIRFALGIGTPEDIIRSYELGWDMFDCVIPTREGRHGRLFKLKIKNKKLKIDFESYNINNAKFSQDFSPINPDSKIPELREYSKAYLHHLFKMREHLGQKLASLNNLEFYNNIIKGL